MIAKTLDRHGKIELVENYEDAISDKSNIWVLHHRDETDKGLTSRQLMEIGMYNNLPPEKLVFLPYLVHQVAHHIGHIPDKGLWKFILRKPLSEMMVRDIGEIVEIMEKSKMKVVRVVQHGQVNTVRTFRRNWK